MVNILVLLWVECPVFACLGRDAYSGGTFVFISGDTVLIFGFYRQLCDGCENQLESDRGHCHFKCCEFKH